MNAKLHVLVYIKYLNKVHLLHNKHKREKAIRESVLYKSPIIRCLQGWLNVRKLVIPISYAASGILGFYQCIFARVIWIVLNLVLLEFFQLIERVLIIRGRSGNI